MNRVFGNNKLLLRKSEFLGILLVSITKLKDLSSLMAAHPAAQMSCLFAFAIVGGVHESEPQPTGFPRTFLLWA